MAESLGTTPSGKRGYKPVKDEIEQLKKAIHLASCGALKRTEKECQTMEIEVSKLITAQQKGLGEKIALSLVLKTETVVLINWRDERFKRNSGKVL